MVNFLLRRRECFRQVYYLQISNYRPVSHRLHLVCLAFLVILNCHFRHKIKMVMAE